MNLKFLGLKNQENLIDDVKLFPLKINRDPRGILAETLKTDWTEVINEKLPFAQTYYSETEVGTARDEQQWHCHPTKQVDRFVIVKGNAVFALFDNREGSKTKGQLNLLLMGEGNTDDNQFLLLIPQNVLHGFLSVGPDKCLLINYPSTLYDKTEEGRIPFSEVSAKLPDDTTFSWQLIRDNITK